MKIDSYHRTRNNTSFKAIHTDQYFSKIIYNRIKRKADLTELEKLFKDAESNNIIDIKLLSDTKKNTLFANVYSTDTNKYPFTLTSFEENFFTKTFGGGVVGFIKKIVKFADKKAEKYSTEIDIKDLNKIFRDSNN